MSAVKIAKMILTKDTCYGMYDAKTPTDNELAEYFGEFFIEEYAKEYHKTQTVVDAENAKLKQEREAQWWNEE